MTDNEITTEELLTMRVAPEQQADLLAVQEALGIVPRPLTPVELLEWLAGMDDPDRLAERSTLTLRRIITAAKRTLAAVEPGVTDLVGEANNLRRAYDAKVAELAAETARADAADNAHIRLIVRLSQDAMFKRATESEDRELALIDAVREWAMRNEIAAPPLDWAGLGTLLDPTAASTPPADEDGAS